MGASSKKIAARQELHTETIEGALNSPKVCRVLRYTTAIIGNQRANQLWWAIRTTVPYMWDNGDVWRLPWDFAPAYCVGAHRSSFAVCRISESLVPVDLYLVYKH